MFARETEDGAQSKARCEAKGEGKDVQVPRSSQPVVSGAGVQDTGRQEQESDRDSRRPVAV